MSAEKPKRVPDAGVSAVEVVLLTPVMMLMVMLIVGLGLMVNTHNIVEGAARDAARAASIQGDTAVNGPDARSAAIVAARADLGNHCAGLADSDIATSFIAPAAAAPGPGLTPIAYFRVTITCRLDMSAVSMFGMFGAQKTVNATFIAPVNTHQTGAGL